jgi:hypothetical protein
MKIEKNGTRLDRSREGEGREENSSWKRTQRGGKIEVFSGARSNFWWGSFFFTYLRFSRGKIELSLFGTGGLVLPSS